MKTFTFVALIVAAAGQASAICAGFNYGVGNQQSLGGGVSRWTVYDDGCKAVDSLTTTGNPCTSGTFGCSPPPVHFNSYTNTFTGLHYACRTDSSSGQCGSDVISVCCRNDGN